MNMDNSSLSFPCVVTASLSLSNIYIAGVDRVECWSSGHLVELSGELVTNNCQTNIADVVDLSVYYDYSTGCDSCSVYYVMKGAAGELLVVHRGDRSSLKVAHRIRGVHRFRIMDMDNIGVARIVTYAHADSEPLPLPLAQLKPDNCSMEVDSVDTDNPSVAKHMSIALQNLKAQLDSLKNELRWKQSVAARGFNASACDWPPDGVLQYNTAALVPLTTVKSDEPPLDPPLVLADQWQRAYNGLWVIGLKVFNKSSRDIQLESLQLILRGNDRFEYQWMILMEDSSESSQHTVFKRSESIIQKFPAYIMICIEIPDLLETRTAKYQFELHFDNYCPDDPGDARRSRRDGFRLTTSVFSLNALNLVNGTSDITFESGVEGYDLACLHMTHKAENLRLSLGVRTATPFQENLICNLQLAKITNMAAYQKTVTYLRGASPTLLGMLLRITEHSTHQYTLNVFASDEAQLVVFACALREILPFGTEITSF